MLYIIWDARFHADPDSAQVMCICNSLKEAQDDRKEYGIGCIIEENEIQDDGKTLIGTGKTW